MARNQLLPEPAKQMYNASEPYHSNWQDPMHDLETDTHRPAEAYYKLNGNCSSYFQSFITTTRSS